MKPKLIPITSLKQAQEHCGSVGHSSVMPCSTKGYSTLYCQTGSKLAKVKPRIHNGEVLRTSCSTCYAHETPNYKYPNVVNAHADRQSKLNDPQWVEAQVYQIENTKKASLDAGYFRGLDSGDFQSIENIQKWTQVARKTKRVSYWFPTQEKAMVREYRAKHRIPGNMVIRESATYVNHPEPQHKVSSVVLDKEYYSQAIKTGLVRGIPVKPCEKGYNATGTCEDCRACWDSQVKIVGYLEH